jgi:ribosomal protein S18 acetylase RimI-like enzyme
MYCMVWDAPAPEDLAPDATPFTAADVAPAVELALLTRPGPFGPRTPELGDYFAYHEQGRLAAMAGERAHVPGYREVSGVATHPDFQGRGYARKLMTKLIRRQLDRGETPFLHVMSSNARAHDLYLRMGFRDHSEPVVRVIRMR